MYKTNHPNKKFFILAGCFLLVYSLWCALYIVAQCIRPVSSIFVWLFAHLFDSSYHGNVSLAWFIPNLIYILAVLTLSILLLLRKNNFAVFISLIIIGLLEIYWLSSYFINQIRFIFDFRYSMDWEGEILYSLYSILDCSLSIAAIAFLAIFSRNNKQSNITKVWFLPAVLQLNGLFIALIQYNTTSFLSLSYISTFAQTTAYIVALFFMGLALTNKAQVSQEKLPA